MENSQKPRARRYRKSSHPRLRWTSELHDHFVQAVRNLGGKYKATPKRIMQVMAVKGLKVSHIKSHLQMYRSMKEPANLKEFLFVKNYQEHTSLCNTHCTCNKYWFERRQFCVGLKEVNFTCQGKWTTDQNGEHIFFHNINHKETQSGAWDCHEFLRANVETQAIGSNQVSETNKHSPINLDLTM